LHQLTEHGFLVVAAVDGVAVYQLAPRSAHSATPAPQQRILLVEDSATIGNVVTVDLQAEGYAVITSTSLAAATELLREIAFDLVLSDGFVTDAAALVTTGQTLRAVAGGTPLVLFTAHRLTLDAAQAAGFSDLITKPFDLERLEQQVRALLQASGDTPTGQGEAGSGTPGEGRS
jgi:two-component system response regulator MtrA